VCVCVCVCAVFQINIVITRKIWKNISDKSAQLQTLCVYVCMYVRTYVRTYIHTHTHKMFAIVHFLSQPKRAVKIKSAQFIFIIYGFDNEIAKVSFSCLPSTRLLTRLLLNTRSLHVIFLSVLGAAACR